MYVRPYRDEDAVPTREIYERAVHLTAARSLFERHGFVVVSQQAPVLRGVEMTNFKMRLTLERAVHEWHN